MSKRIPFHRHLNNPRILAILALFALGATALLLSARAASPYIAVEAESGSLSAPAVTGTDSTASGGQYALFGTSPGPTPPPPAPTPTPTAPPPSPPPAGTYPARNSVGYKSSNCPGGTTVINSSGTAPAGTSWGGGYLTVSSSNVSLNCVWIKGGLYLTANTGTFTVKNSIIEGGSAWFIFYSVNGSAFDIEDSTLRWLDGSSTIQDVNSGAGAIQVSDYSTGTKILRNDIGGLPDGIQASGDNWVISQNWIHKPAILGSYPNNTHNDGIQVYHGSNMQITYNRIELGGFDGVHQNGAIFFQVDTAPNPQIIGNYLEGGGVVARFEGPTGIVMKDNVFGPLDTSVVSWPYYYYANNGATISVWTNNCKGDAAGTAYVPCQAVSQ